jgi:predicted ATPase/DNA-binding SARP family transcriptional activator
MCLNHAKGVLMARLEIVTLGPPAIRLEGKPATGLASDKVRALLFYLAVEADRPQRRESLAGLLWPEYPERSARTNLSNALSNLRTALGDREAKVPFFYVSREAIQFNAGSDGWIDAAAFEERAARGKWEEADALYRGPFLEGFSIADSSPFEQWALVGRERLQREAMEALGHLAARHAERGDLAGAIAATRRQLEIEPWYESAHRALMRALALSGERASALAQYEACARTLKRELDVAPGVETTELYEDIRDGRVVPRKEIPRRREVDPTPVKTAPAAAIPPAGERRWVTALHAEVNQAAALLDEVGPEEWTKAMTSALDMVEDEIRRYGGEVLERREVGVVALFGVPSAHEDDAERAVLAALGMRGGMRDAPELRIGVDSGEVLVTYAGDRRQVVGRALTLARRASVAADPDAVSVGENAYRLLHRLFEWEEPAERVARGIHHPLARKVDTGKGRGIPGLSSPLVGRDEELCALQQAVKHLRSGIGGVITLVGEAGLGKSRLAAEVRTGIGAVRGPPLHWVEGRCLSYATHIAYQLWLDTLRQVLGVAPDAPPTAVRDVLRERVRALCPDYYDDVYPYLCRLMSLPLEDEYEIVRNLGGESLRAEVFHAVETLVESAARQRPLVVVCEDLHWADLTSLALLERVLPLVDRVPLLLLCVFRPETEHGCWRIRETAAREYRHRHTDLRLDPLTAAESATLVGNLLRVEDLPDTLKAKILAHAQGNPFYVEEILRSLIDDQAIAYDEGGGHWQAIRPVDDITLPETLHAMLSARIDRLPPEAKRTLQLASVVGRIFTHPVLAEVVPRFPLPQVGKTRGGMKTVPLDTHLLTLQRAQLIRERTRMPEREYVFQHVLTQEAAYGSLLKGERRRCHRQVAEALERLYAERIEEQLGLLVHHWEQAEEPDKAIEYLLRAGEQSRLAYANEEAIDYYRRALALLENTPLGAAQRKRRLAALSGLGIVYFGMGRVSEAEPPLQEAAALGKEMGIAPQDLARIYYWLGETLWWQGRYGERLCIGEEGLALLGDDTESIEAALMNQTIAFAVKNMEMYLKFTFRTAQFIQRFPYIEELRPAYDHVILAYAYTKNVDEAVRWAHILEEKAAVRHDLRGSAEAYGELGVITSKRGNLHEAISYHQQALELYVRIGDIGHEGWSLRAIGQAFLSLGDLYKVAKYARESLEIAKVVGFKRDIGLAYQDIGLVALCYNDWHRAVRFFRMALQLQRERERTGCEEWASYFLGQAYLAQGNCEQAVENLQKAVDLMGLGAMREHPLEFAVALSGLEKAFQDIEAFHAFCRRFREEYPETGGLPFVQWYLEPAMVRAIHPLTAICGKPPLRDDFSTGLASDWTWHDPLDDCSFEVQDGLEIRAANARDLWNINLSAPRMLRMAPGDLVIQTICVPVSDEQPTIGGLLLWMGKENYLRLDRGVFGKQDVSLMGCLDNADIVIGRGRLYGDSGHVYLRLERSGGRVNAYCSADDKQWFTVGQVAFPEGSVQVGVHAIGNIDRTIYHGAYPEGTAIRFESFWMWRETPIGTSNQSTD